jgi:hypothetical protein
MDTSRPTATPRRTDRDDAATATASPDSVAHLVGRRRERPTLETAEDRRATEKESRVIKVTVLYNLPPDADEREFVRWRTTEHHAANIARPGVIRADFYRVLGTPMVGPTRPASDEPPYRFITESWWATYDSFVASWNDPEEQARLVPAVAKISDALFLISEELQTYVAPV